MCTTDPCHIVHNRPVSYYAQPTRIILCTTDPYHIVHNRPVSYCAQPTRVILCTTDPYHIVHNRPVSYCAQPTRIILCTTDPCHIVHNRPGSDMDGLVTSGQTYLVRKQAGVHQSSDPVSGRTQPARCQFPTFRLGSVLPQTARTILCKTSPDPVWFWLTVSGFWPNRSGPEGSRCARIIRPASGQCFSTERDRIRIRSGMFTGNRRLRECCAFYSGSSPFGRRR